MYEYACSGVHFKAAYEFLQDQLRQEIISKAPYYLL